MDLHPTVTEFFHDAVTEALSKRHVDATEPTEFYLVNLLTEFMNTRSLSTEPLALKLAEVSSKGPDERARGLKEIGDTSLYVSGFFSESLQRKLVPVDYYVAMGGAAYGQLANLIGMTHGSATGFFRQVYNELAAKFARFVEVLGEIRRGLNFTSSELDRLMRAWSAIPAVGKC
jgi:hypothetical protein